MASILKGVKFLQRGWLVKKGDFTKFEPKSFDYWLRFGGVRRLNNPHSGSAYGALGYYFSYAFFLETFLSRGDFVLRFYLWENPTQWGG